MEAGLRRGSDSESEMLMRTGSLTGWPSKFGWPDEEAEAKDRGRVPLGVGESAKIAAASARVCSAELLLLSLERLCGVFPGEDSSASLERTPELSSKRGVGETDISGSCEVSLLSLSSPGEKREKLGASGVESRLEPDCRSGG
jgi:hypothetical protein